MRARIALAAVVLLLVVGGIYMYWQSSPPDSASVFATGRNGECIVSNGEGRSERSVACAEVSQYLRTQLGLEEGAKVTIAATRHVSATELENLRATLAGGGYRTVNVIKAIGFVEENAENR